MKNTNANANVIMNVTTLMYHDVTARNQFASSGFVGADADLYKLTTEDFTAHLEAIERVGVRAPSRADVLLKDAEYEGRGDVWMITFDDGGASAYDVIAPMLEARNWRGHFFIASDYIGAKTFLSKSQLRDLHRRGHIIGSHSQTHPLRMAIMSSEDLRREWSVSVQMISEILGEPVRIASVPGGLYSRSVAEAAREAGIEVLFNSEPTTRGREVAGCKIFGRFTIQQHTSAETARRMAAGDRFIKAKETAVWNAKKIARRVGGESYLKLRQALIERKQG